MNNSEEEKLEWKKPLDDDDGDKNEWTAENLWNKHRSGWRKGNFDLLFH